MTSQNQWKQEQHARRLRWKAANQSTHWFKRALINFAWTVAIVMISGFRTMQRRSNDSETTNAVSFFGMGDEEFEPQLDFIGVNYYRNVSVHYCLRII